MTHIPYIRALKKDFYKTIADEEKVFGKTKLSKTSVWNARKFLEITPYDQLSILEEFSSELGVDHKRIITAHGHFFIAYRTYKFTIIFLDRHYNADVEIRLADYGTPSPLLTTIKFRGSLNILSVLEDYIKMYKTRE